MRSFIKKIGRGIRSFGRGVAIVGGFLLEVIHVIGQAFKAIAAIFD